MRTAPSPMLLAQRDSLALPTLGRGLVCPSAHALEKRGQRDREEGNGWDWQVALQRLTASRQQPWVMLA